MSTPVGLNNFYNPEKQKLPKIGQFFCIYPVRSLEILCFLSNALSKTLEHGTSNWVYFSSVYVTVLAILNTCLMATINPAAETKAIRFCKIPAITVVNLPNCIPAIPITNKAITATRKGTLSLSEILRKPTISPKINKTVTRAGISPPKPAIIDMSKPSKNAHRPIVIKFIFLEFYFIPHQVIGVVFIGDLFFRSRCITVLDTNNYHIIYKNISRINKATCGKLFLNQNVEVKLLHFYCLLPTDGFLILDILYNL